jgi:uncharacterized protein
MPDGDSIPNVTVRLSPINRSGAFALRDFKKGEVVVPWENTRELSQAEYTALLEAERAYIEMQGDKILLVGAPERYINHSCDANTVPGVFCDIAARDIKSGEEVTTDYRHFFIPEGSFTCACGSPLCRGTIRRMEGA